MSLFESFLKERSKILEDIKQFLFMILKYIFKLKKETEGRSVEHEEFAAKISCNVQVIVESLCLIHALFGYPDNFENCGNNKLSINKHAVMDLVKNIALREKGVHLTDYCEEIKEAKFWTDFRFNDENFFQRNLQLREPAHVFIQMVRDITNNDKSAAVMARLCLEGLPDVNFLKPVVWAEHSNKPGCCGVSLGVRSFVRPLYLYLKLSQLREIKDSDCGVKLEDVCAFQCVNRKKLKNNSLSCSKYKKSKNEEELLIKKPCKSCKIFFDPGTPCLTTSIPPFGNCAEYDIIRTENLNYVLENVHWEEFKSACHRHIAAFNELIREVKESQRNPAAENMIQMKKYYDITRDAKVLSYQRNNSDSYELVAKDWPYMLTNE